MVLLRLRCAAMEPPCYVAALPPCYVAALPWSRHATWLPLCCHRGAAMPGAAAQARGHGFGGLCCAGFIYLAPCDVPTPALPPAMPAMPHAVCNNSTWHTCMEQQMFGLPQAHWCYVQYVRMG